MTEECQLCAACFLRTRKLVPGWRKEKTFSHRKRSVNLLGESGRRQKKRKREIEISKKWKKAVSGE